jgi:hypothetical protein
MHDALERHVEADHLAKNTFGPSGTGLTPLISCRLILLEATQLGAAEYWTRSSSSLTEFSTGLCRTCSA